MLTKHKMTWEQTLFLKFSTPSERKLQVKYWGSRLEAADGCTSDECTKVQKSGKISNLCETFYLFEISLV